MTRCAVTGCNRTDVKVKNLCEKHYRRTIRTGHPGPPGPTLQYIWFDPQPLLDALTNIGGLSPNIATTQHNLPTLQRAIQRAKRADKITAATIDKICAATGLSPETIYGREWWTRT